MNPIVIEIDEEDSSNKKMSSRFKKAFPKLAEALPKITNFSLAISLTSFASAGYHPIHPQDLYTHTHVTMVLNDIIKAQGLIFFEKCNQGSIFFEKCDQNLIIFEKCNQELNQLKINDQNLKCFEDHDQILKSYDNSTFETSMFCPRRSCNEQPVELNNTIANDVENIQYTKNLSIGFDGKLRSFEVSINPLKYNNFQILHFPENFQISSLKELSDADLSYDLSKALKQSGLKCINFYDSAVRQSDEMYFGVIWILDKIAIPIFNTVVSALLVTLITNNRNNKKNKNIIHIEIHFPNGNIIKHNDDAETLIERLRQEEKY